jgi:shikimate dehydrogenase
VAQGRQVIHLALFGKPIKTSLSPAIHSLFAAQFGLEISYQLIETGVEGFPKALEDFRLEGGAACNVTLPLKQEAWRMAAQATEEVSQAQAANTLVYQPSSGWFAHTTDGVGLITDLSVNHGVGIEGQRVLIMGAGGAVAGILGRLMAAAPREVVLVNRNLERAGLLAERFESLGKITITGWENLPALGRFGLVINATSLGHQGKAPPLPASSFAQDAVCYDLNYFKASQPLRSLVEAMGQRYLDGLGMLVEQAAGSFYIWTGQRPDSDVVTEKCRDMVK